MAYEHSSCDLKAAIIRDQFHSCTTRMTPSVSSAIPNYVRFQLQVRVLIVRAWRTARKGLHDDIQAASAASHGDRPANGLRYITACQYTTATLGIRGV
jgi:hypothetical protein